MKKALWLMAVLSLLISLAACEKADDTDSGMWNAISYTHLGIEKDIGEIFRKGASLELRDNGSCVVNIDGESARGEWDLTGGILRIKADEANFVGIVDGRTLVLDVEAYGINVYFRKTGEAPSVEPEDPEDDSVTSPINAQRIDSGPYEWWFGEWFGVMSIIDMSDYDEILDGYKWDCFANVYYMIDDTSVLDIFGFGMTIGNIVVRIDTDSGLTDKGKAVAVSGNMLGAQIEPGVLEIDPGISLYENSITWNWREDYEDGEYVEYQILFRPWGTLWDDIPEDDRPDSYDWYLEVIDNSLSDIGIHIHE